MKSIKNTSVHYQGIMPIRVLQHNLIVGFENANSEFKDLTKQVVTNSNLVKVISYTAEEERIKSPHVTFGQIAVQETFLSYVWCISFSLTVLYSEVVVKKAKNDTNPNDEEQINFEFARDAYQLWEYALSLIDDYSAWDINLPNPEIYSKEYEDLIPRINAMYIEAMKFVLAHEFAHVELEHSSRINPGIDENVFNKQIEKEADERAIELILKGMDESNSMTIKVGILAGLCSLLFFKSTTKELQYPDVDNRIHALIIAIDPDDIDPMWGFAALAYRLWDKHFQKNLIWEEGLDSPKELYFSIKRQVEQML